MMPWREKQLGPCSEDRGTWESYKLLRQELIRKELTIFHMKEGLRLQTWEQKAYTRLFREQLVAEPRVLQKVCLKTRWAES